MDTPVLNYGEGVFQERHSQVFAATSLSYSTLRDYGWVAEKFKPPRRRGALEWYPHRDVAGLEELGQDTVLHWIELYAAEHEGEYPTRSEIREQVRLYKREKVVESLAEMKGKYRVVYADPPWQYSDSGASSEGSFGKAEDHYPTMSIADIAAVPVEAHIRPRSVLFMWTTTPLLLQNPGPREVIEAWGFDYKSEFVWDKDAHVVGSYVSVQHEHLLICTRGSCCPAPEDLKPMIDSVQTIPRGRRRHSEKPEIFRQHIKRLYPRGPYLELFARRQVPGWTVYGNQIGSPVQGLSPVGSPL